MHLCKTQDGQQKCSRGFHLKLSKLTKLWGTELYFLVKIALPLAVLSQYTRNSHFLVYNHPTLLWDFRSSESLRWTYDAERWGIESYFSAKTAWQLQPFYHSTIALQRDNERHIMSIAELRNAVSEICQGQGAQPCKKWLTLLTKWDIKSALGWVHGGDYNCCWRKDPVTLYPVYSVYGPNSESPLFWGCSVVRMLDLRLSVAGSILSQLFLR